MIDREEKRSKLDQDEISAPKCTVKSFYGKKTTNLRWTKPKVKATEIANDGEISDEISNKHTEKCKPQPVNNDKLELPIKRSFNKEQHTGSCKEQPINGDKPEVYQEPVKRFYKRDDMFWTTNVYGKKRKTETTSTDDLRRKERKIDILNTTASRSPKNVNCSVETQTSFSSSQETNTSQQANSSPIIIIARSSPFLNDVGSKDTSLNESMETADDVTNSDDSEPYEMFNCDISSSQLNSSFKSDTSNVSPQKKTPKRKKEPNLLNYFTKMDKSRSPAEKMTSPREAVQNKEERKKSGQTQLHFSKCGLASRNEVERDDSVLFDLSSSSTKTTPRRKKKVMKRKATTGTPKEQMYIDIGQKDFGHVKCETCGMVYTKSQEEDEEQHAKYHQRIVQKLRFNGWKNERVIEEFFDGRIISIKHSDYFMHLKKLNEIREVVDTELGFASSQERDLKQDEQAFLFICSKKVVGCVIAIPITKAYPIIPDTKTESDEKRNGEARQSWCCSTEPVKALCGISRIWAFSQNRRQKIATRLVECIRRNFLYGCIIEKSKLAFSDPTPNGRIFAEKYIGKEDFPVFR